MKKCLPVDELGLLQTDHFVAKLEGTYQIRSHGDFIIQVAEDDRVNFPTQTGRSFPFAPTVDWRQGGPIVENNGISIEKVSTGWRAHCGEAAVGTGSTPLIAAMRTRVKLKYGAEVEVE